MDASEAQPTLGETSQVLTAFNPPVTGIELADFGFSIDSLGERWDIQDGDPDLAPLTLPLANPFEVYLGDSFTISNTRAGIDTVIALIENEGGYTGVGAASTGWDTVIGPSFFPDFAGAAGSFTAVTPFGASDGPKAAYDNTQGFVLVSESVNEFCPTSDPDQGQTRLHIFGSFSGSGACEDNPGAFSCQELTCVDVSPPAGSGAMAPLCPSKGGPHGGSRFGQCGDQWGTHAPVVGFNHEAWVFFMQENPLDPTHPIPTLAGYDPYYGLLALYPIWPFASSAPTSLVPCPSGLDTDACIPTCNGAYIRSAQLLSLAYGVDPRTHIHHLYTAWNASTEEGTGSVLQSWLITVDVDDNPSPSNLIGWPPVVAFRNLDVTLNGNHNEFMPAIAADPLGEKVALITYDDNGCPDTGGSAGCKANACATLVNAHVSDDAGGLGLSDLLYSSNSEIISDTFTLDPFVDTYLTDYLGATALRGTGELYATWTEAVPSMSLCGTTFNTGLQANIIRSEGQAWGNWIDPPLPGGCSQAARGDESTCDATEDACLAAGESDEECATEKLTCKEAERDHEKECKDERDAVSDQVIALLGSAPKQHVIAPSAIYTLPAFAPTGTPRSLGASCASDADCDPSFGYICDRGLCGCPATTILCGSACATHCP